MVKILLVAGAQPNFMKVEPVMRALEAYPRFDVKLVYTGQHYDRALSATFFEELGFPVRTFIWGWVPGPRPSRLRR